MAGGRSVSSSRPDYKVMHRHHTGASRGTLLKMHQLANSHCHNLTRLLVNLHAALSICPLLHRTRQALGVAVQRRRNRRHLSRHRHLGLRARHLAHQLNV